MNKWTELAERAERYKKALEEIAFSCEDACEDCHLYLADRQSEEFYSLPPCLMKTARETLKEGK